jgi:SNF2 family DNA or RNA helicase
VSNLLIADDVGLGKTIEAGLILRELFLRRRIDFTAVAAPPSMTLQWQDELEAKFGLAFTIIDRERLAELRRSRGFGVTPWSTGSRFIISHHLLTDETYVAGLRDLLGVFRPRALLILDEAHHAAPASGARYAIDSQFTKAIRGLVDPAREGINPQTRCHDLIHVDLPWNPSRLEQRNGRVDRKLQPAPEVFCRYFVYAQREEDVVLAALVRKTETIRAQLGSAGQVIQQRIADRLNATGIERGRAAPLAEAIDAETDTERLARARAEMDDEEHARHERLLRDLDDLWEILERSRERVGVDPEGTRTRCRCLPSAYL